MYKGGKMSNEAKKKAKELIFWFYNELNPDAPDCNISFRQAKQCALKVCKENIEALNQSMLCKQSVRDLYQQVKTDIENYE